MTIFSIIITAAVFVSCSSGDSYPEVRIVYPADGAILTTNSASSLSDTILVEASDDDGVVYTELLCDGNPRYYTADYTEPYQFALNFASYEFNQYHTIKAVAYDRHGNAGYSDPVEIYSQYDFAIDGNGYLQFSINYYTYDTIDVDSESDPYFILKIWDDTDSFTFASDTFYDNDDVDGAIIDADIPDYLVGFHFTVSVYDWSSEGDRIIDCSQYSGRVTDTLSCVTYSLPYSTSNHNGNNDNIPDELDGIISIDVRKMTY